MEPERFFIWDASSGKPIAVRFEQLSVNDREELEGANWTAARFRATWIGVVSALGDPDCAKVLKLVSESGDPPGILGLVMINTQSYGRFLKYSLLETAPRYRYGRKRNRTLEGIGKVLIARLIVESQARGKHGRVLVNPVQGSREFYRELGFRPRQGSTSLVCNEQAAKQILEAVRAKD